MSVSDQEAQNGQIMVKDVTDLAKMKTFGFTESGF